MTLAIGVKYPYGRLQEALASLPQAHLPRAIILGMETPYAIPLILNIYVDFLDPGLPRW